MIAARSTAPRQPCSSARYLLLLRRDDRADLAWPGRLDLPGGGREGAESGWQTIRRETLEELSLDVATSRRLWARRYPAGGPAARQSWFFVLRLPAIPSGRLTLGDEGQGWTLLTPASYLGRTDAIPRQQARVADYLAWTKTAPAAFTATGA